MNISENTVVGLLCAVLKIGFYGIVLEFLVLLGCQLQSLLESCLNFLDQQLQFLFNRSSNLEDSIQTVGLSAFKTLNNSFELSVKGVTVLDVIKGFQKLPQG